MGGAKQSAERAAAFEAEALEYPDERGELLLNALVNWRRAGHPDRAYALADELVAAGGSDGCFARIDRIEFLLEDGYRDRAATEIAELARNPALEDGHCQMVGEMLDEFGDIEEASAWYDRAVARLREDQIAALREENAGWAYAATVVRGRRNVREKLGLPPDAMDLLVPEPPQWNEPHPLDRAPELTRGAEARLCLPVFLRGERAEALRVWPEDEALTDDAYYAVTELAWRQLRDNGGGTIDIAPMTVAALRTFAEHTDEAPTDPDVQARYARTVAPSERLSWPPSRNDPCWCGSASKYKKCCGRPGLTTPG